MGSLPMECASAEPNSSICVKGLFLWNGATEWSKDHIDPATLGSLNLILTRIGYTVGAADACQSGWCAEA